MILSQEHHIQKVFIPMMGVGKFDGKQAYIDIFNL